MPNIQNNWGTDLYKFVGKTFDINCQNWKQKRPILSLLGEVTTDSAFYDLAAGGDFPELPDYDGTMKKINPLRGFRKVIEPSEKLGSYDIHYKQWLNDKSGEAKKAGKQLSDSAEMSVYMSVLRLFQNAFSSSQLGGDGVAWASTSHPVASKGGKAGEREYEADTEAGTFSNLITSELSIAAIDEALAKGYRYVTPAGKPFLADYSLLIVSPELEATAKKLLGDNAKVSMQADMVGENKMNPYAGQMRYIVMGGGNVGFSAKQWAIADAAKLKETAAIVYNTKPEVQQATNTNPYVKTFVAYCDYALGFADARPIIFSNPS